MNQSFIISATVYTIVMVLFHLIKDVFIGKNIAPDIRARINKRWLISTAIGLIVLYLIYGRDGPY